MGNQKSTITDSRVDKKSDPIIKFSIDDILKYTSIYNIIESQSKYNWLPISKDIIFDRNKIQHYLNKFTDKNDKLFVTNILQSTIHISYLEFYSQLIETFNKLEQLLFSIDRDKIIIYYPFPHFGSENWIIQLMWNRIKQWNTRIQFITTLTQQLDENDCILIIDDCSYSGNNILSIIDNLTYSNSYNNDENTYDETMLDQESFYADKKYKSFELYVTVPFITTHAYSVIKEFAEKRNITINIIYNSLLIPPKYSDDMIEKFEIGTYGVFPIYFDHKVANNFGSFPQIYLRGLYYIDNEKHYFGSLFVKNPSRQVIINLEKSISNFINNKLAHESIQ